MKRLFACLLALVMIMSAAGCTSKATETPPASTAAAETATAAETTVETAVTETGSYPLTVTDQAGRTVTLEARPERIVSGYYISSSLIIALGQADKLVGIEAKADKRAIYRLSAPALMELPSVGSAREFDLEGCAALEPDLVILPLKLKEAAASLESLGIPVILVNPENRQLLNETRDLVAACLDCQDSASVLAGFTEKIQSDLEAVLADAGKPRVYLAGNSSLLSTAGGSMYQSDLIELAGGENVAKGIPDTYWAEIDYEQLLTWNPDYIILASDASYTPEDVKNDPNLAGVAAVENGRIFRMPNLAEAWDSPVPGGILGAVWMASELHSDLITEETCNEIVEEFYETFYNFRYSEA